MRKRLIDRDQFAVNCEAVLNPVKMCRDDISVIPANLLFGSLAIMVTKNNRDGRPITLRHYLSVILRFGWLVDLDQHCALILDAELCAAVF